MRNTYLIILVTLIIQFFFVENGYSREETVKKIHLSKKELGGIGYKSLPIIPIEAFIEGNILTIFFLQETVAQTNCTIIIRNHVEQIVYEESIVAEEGYEHLIIIDREETQEYLLEIKMNGDSFYGKF